MANLTKTSLPSHPIEAESSLCQHTNSIQNECTEHAIHDFFKHVSDDSSYTVMLGGSLTSNQLNQTILIGLKLKQLIYVKNRTLFHESLAPQKRMIQKQRLSDPNHLFHYLRSQDWTNHAFLFTSYEFYHYCDTALWNTSQHNISDDSDLLLIDFEDIGRFDLNTQAWHWHSPSSKRIEHYQNLWQDHLNRVTESAQLKKYNTPDISDIENYAKQFSTSLSEASFEEAISQILKHIQDGNIYQANLSLSLQKEVSVCPYQLYRYLCQQNPSPFSAFLKMPNSYLISNSPERLLTGHTDNHSYQLETRPIAGTRGRSSNINDDQIIANKLSANIKERAEHLMLVDLLRNDLGRVCTTGSVHVSELLTIERYSHVMHLVSNVVGELSPQHDYWDALKSLFPGGTITGCPKLRCIQILNSLEDSPRGFYTGSLGYINTSAQKPWGERVLDWNILIRTLKLSNVDLAHAQIDKTTNATLPYNATLQSQHPTNRYLARLQVGAGIVADSVATYEYRECYRKAQALLGALYVTEQPTNCQ